MTAKSGVRATTRRHTLPKVNFDNFDGILSFVHVNKNHWNMLYIHAKSGTVYQMDPSPASSELEDSTHAAQRLQEYLKIRKHQGKTDWVDVKWKGGVMPHPVQMDGCSCGVIVVEMARAVMEAFPEFPKMNFSTKRRAMEEARRDMALQVLESSVFDEETCSMCGADKPPGQAPPVTDWQKTMIRMIQDLHRSIQGGQRMSTTSRHNAAYSPLGDKLALEEALEGDLASQRDLRHELGSCF
ncbi:unnamed protein product [Gadus morhua 'NCC']